MKSELSSEILLLLLGLVELGFFGLGQKFIIAVRIEAVGSLPLNISLYTSHRLSPRLLQHYLNTKVVMPSDPADALKFDEDRVLKISAIVGEASNISLSLSVKTTETSFNKDS